MVLARLALQIPCGRPRPGLRVQACVGAVMTGDVNKVTAAQLASVGGLTCAFFPGSIILRRHEGAWGRRDLGDVYIDDVATLVAVMDGVGAFYLRGHPAVHTKS